MRRRPVRLIVNYFCGARVFSKKWDLRFIYPKGCSTPGGYLAGTDKHRAEIVNQLFADKSVEAIVCARGGYGSLRILHLLDYDTIAQNPKIFIGFSDITALLTVLFDRCGLVTFHGPVVTSLADANEITKQSAFSNGLIRPQAESRGAQRGHR